MACVIRGRLARILNGSSLRLLVPPSLVAQLLCVLSNERRVLLDDAGNFSFKLLVLVSKLVDALLEHVEKKVPLRCIGCELLLVLAVFLGLCQLNQCRDLFGLEERASASPFKRHLLDAMDTVRVLHDV